MEKWTGLSFFLFVYILVRGFCFLAKQSFLALARHSIHGSENGECQKMGNMRFFSKARTVDRLRVCPSNRHSTRVPPFYILSWTVQVSAFLSVRLSICLVDWIKDAEETNGWGGVKADVYIILAKQNKSTVHLKTFCLSLLSMSK